MDNPVIFIALIGVIIVLAIFLPRWIRRSTLSAGDRAEKRIAESRLAPILDELGTTLSLRAPVQVAREIVDGAALQQPRKFTVLPDGAYGIRFVEPDDAVARLVEDADGTRLQVEGFREHLGMPNTSAFWADLRAAVATDAKARGIPVDAGPAVRHRRDDTTGSWRLDESSSDRSPAE